MSQQKPIERPLWLFIPLLGVASLLVAGVITIGGQYISAPILFPMLIGVAGGVFGSLLADRVRMSGTLRALFAGVVISLLTYVAYHYLSYLITLNALADELTFSFEEYLMFKSDTGSPIGRRGSTWFTLTGAGVWILWGIETVIAGGIGGWIGRNLNFDEIIPAQNPKNKSKTDIRRSENDRT